MTDFRPKNYQGDEPRNWHVLADWSYNNGGTVALGACTKGYPNNVGAPLGWTEAEALQIADLLNADQSGDPTWYAAPHSNVSED